MSNSTAVQQQKRKLATEFSWVTMRFSLNTNSLSVSSAFSSNGSWCVKHRISKLSLTGRRFGLHYRFTVGKPAKTHVHEVIHNTESRKLLCKIVQVRYNWLRWWLSAERAVNVPRCRGCLRFYARIRHFQCDMWKETYMTYLASLSSIWNRSHKGSCRGRTILDVLSNISTI